MKPTCRATKADGTPCGSTLGIRPSGLCRLHDPSCSEEVQEMRRAGGRGAAAAKRKARAALPDGVPKKPETIEDATRWASWAVRAVSVGEIDVRTCHEIGYVLRAFVDAQKHVDKIDDRMKTLTAKLKAIGEAEELAGGTQP